MGSPVLGVSCAIGVAAVISHTRLGVNTNKYGERCEKYGPVQMIVTGECDYLC
jgi:hypothetical protein